MSARKWMRNKFVMRGLLALLSLSLVATAMLDGSTSASTDVSGGIYADTTWTEANSPYSVIPSVTPTPLPTPGCRLEGDVNYDLIIDSADMQLIAQHIVGTITLTGDSFDAADVNDNSLIDAADLQLMAQYLIGTITAFPGGAYIP